MERPGESTRKRAGGYDPAFRAAVETGRLTAAEAYARGSRSAYVARLVRRFGIGEELAGRVADNEVSLADAVPAGAGRQAPPPVPGEPPDVRGIGRRIAVVVALIGLATTVTVRWALGETDAAVAALRDTVAAGVTVDRAGNVVRVIADSPDTVLATYCRERQGRCAPLGLMPSSRPDAPVRIGVIRSGAGDHSARALPIRFDPGSRRWYAGDGSRPLAASHAPPGAIDAVAGDR